MREKWKKNYGYSLGELLTVVAIITILFSVAIPSVAVIQKNLRQMELDSKAGIIYVAVQNQLSKMKAGGKLAPCGTLLGKKPGDAQDEDNVSGEEIYYFTSSNAADASVAAIMNPDTLDEALLNNHWVVEYNPSSAIVYAVFYSEDRADCGDEYAKNYEKYDALRFKSKRLADGAKVGYYGGGSAADSSTVTTMTPLLTITNAEKLAANISCVLPDSGSDYPVFKVDLKDGAGKIYTQYYAYLGSSDAYKQEIAREANGNVIDYTSMSVFGRACTLELILDDLSSADTRFVNAYGTGSSHSVQLEAGTSLTVTVTAMCPGNYKYTQNLSDSRTTNSLFADASTEDTAVISCARHLQNLDASSGIVSTIKNAQQNHDITFTDQLSAVSASPYTDWFETYGGGYFNGLTTGVPNFKPIQNSNLQSYDGASKHIAKLTAEADADAGLFAALGVGQAVKRVALTGTKVSSQNGSAGALVGTVTDGAKIEHCQVYLTASDIKEKNHHNVWIQGKTAGGLIGTVHGGTGNGKDNNGNVKDSTVNITDSSASTVVGGHTYDAGTVTDFHSVSAGGLIGSVAEGSVLIDGCYADCYLFGESVGGLVGTSSGSVNVDSCYAAGFETFGEKGAGLVCGNADMRRTYTMVQPMDMDRAKPYYSTSISGKDRDNLYYAVSSSNGQGQESNQGKPISKMHINALTNGEKKFTEDSATARPYNLMGQALTAYPYPVLEGVKHYGDWMADFQEGSLVYYEAYSDGTYGFFGANVTSTLKDDAGLAVVGDGYGIVYQNTSSLPSQVTVTVGNGDPSALTVSDGSPYPVPGTDGVGYNIYPLSKELVNTTAASAQYYLKAQITSGGKTDTYYFNPHFAKTVVGPLADASADAPVLTADSNIAVRTPRHLYMMSLYYDTYAEATKECTFEQERNIDYASYEWTDYSTRSGDVRSQEPIAGKGTAFQAVYDGGCHWITNVSFTTKTGLYVGFIGQNAGTIENVVLTATYEETGADNYHVRRSGNINNNQAVYLGVLAGQNNGRIHNCAVSGYYIAGSDGTIHAYENSYLYAGGLVGENAGTIVNCSADTPTLRLSSTYANVCLGGFAGANSSYISNCYALGHIEAAFAKGGRVSIAGFAGRNSARIQNSYCATALTASGDVTASYGFAPFGGQVKSCYYLNNGTYAYISHMYPFNFAPCDGTSATFAELKANSAGSRAVNCYDFRNTETVSKQYPFRAVVRDGSGDLVHYGDWLDDENLGTVGIFYWEHEEGGSNDGYHFTYLGADNDNMTGGTTLCNAHDDGGVITEYGYGYYELVKGSVTGLALTGATINGKDAFDSKDAYNKAASEALEKQIHKTQDNGTEKVYTFYAFTTRTEEDAKKKDDGKGYLCLSGTTPNCTWTLTHEESEGQEKEYTYTVSPFFANAMSRENGPQVTAFDGTITTYSEVPGAGESNQYEIRSIQQLQYINWNYENKNTSTLVEHKDRNTYKQFPYLMYATTTSTNKVEQKEQITDGKVMYWRQTHDVDGSGFEGYTPIAGNYESTTADSYNVNLYAWFGSSYNGESYKIQNVAITSNSFAVGLFGVTVGANMKNIIMYSDKDTNITRSSDNKVGAYSLGGLIGVAYDYNVAKTTNYIENCAIAGYKIVDGSTNQQGLGEANVGGLIGVANVHLKNCSAVTDISIECTHEKAARYGVFLRVGGLTGAAQGTVENCYSGGSAAVSYEALNGKTDYGSYTKQTRIYIGGIAGSGFTSNYYNFTGKTGSFDGSPTLKNCYTYFKFPDPASFSKATGDGSTRELVMFTVASMADRVNESNAGKAHVTITNCYYLDSIMTSGVQEVYSGSKNYYRTEGKPESRAYIQMSDGTMLAKLGDSFSPVTTTEGSLNVPINGKYSFPGSNYALEGKNYPFPAVIRQKDLTFSTADNSVDVYVHYGEWPVDTPYWKSGRDKMDIFADMQTTGDNAGWATKTFYLNPNGKELALTTDSFTCAQDIAEVVNVGEKDTETGLYPVTVKAKNTGTEVITFQGGGYTAAFALEVTADIDVTADPASLTLKQGEDRTVTLSAKSRANETHSEIDYSTDSNSGWTLETVEDGGNNLVKVEQQNSKNIWKAKRDGLGKVTLKAAFTYHYHGTAITKATYIDVLQPDTVGLSNGQSYDAAYLGTETAPTGSQVSYSTNPPSVENADFFLYLDAEELQIRDLTVQSVTVGGKTAVKKTDEPGNVYETTGEGTNFHIEWDEPTSDKNYQYLPGFIYVTGDADVLDVELAVTVSVGGREYTLSVTLLEVKKAVNVTYQDGVEADGHSFTKQVLVGSHRLPTQDEVKTASENLIPGGKTLVGWKADGAAVYQPGYLYDFTADVTFTAVFEDAAMPPDENNSSSEGEEP